MRYLAILLTTRVRHVELDTTRFEAVYREKRSLEEETEVAKDRFVSHLSNHPIIPLLYAIPELSTVFALSVPSTLNEYIRVPRTLVRL